MQKGKVRDKSGSVGNTEAFKSGVSHQRSLIVSKTFQIDWSIFFLFSLQNLRFLRLDVHTQDS